MMNLYLSTLVVLSGVIASTAQGIPPQSSCPGILSYSREHTRNWHGNVNIVKDGYFSEVFLEVTMTVANYIPELGFGKIEVKGGDSKVQDISQKAARGEWQTVEFIIVFPPINEIPVVTAVSVDGKTICRNQQSNHYSGRINVNYRLRTGLPRKPESPSRPESPARPDTLTRLDNNNDQSQPITQPHRTRQRTTPVTSRTTTTAWSYNDYDEEVTTPRRRPPQRKPTTEPPYYEDEVSVDSATCGVASSTTGSPNSLIIRGYTARRGQWPWHIALYVNAYSPASGHTSKFQCGGTLITAQHVITAGHCVRPDQRRTDPKDVTIYLGKHNLRKVAHSQSADVERIIVHPEYDIDKGKFDIAVIILTEQVTFGQYVKPICLWQESNRIATNQLGTVVGWGKDEDYNYGEELKMAQLPVVSDDVCLRSDPFFVVFASKNTFCAGDKIGSAPCNGDSGGGMYFYLNNPLQGRKTWYLRGIVSLSKKKISDDGSTVCDDTQYAIFTDVSKMLPWIRRQLV